MRIFFNVLERIFRFIFYLIILFLLRRNNRLRATVNLFLLRLDRLVDQLVNSQLNGIELSLSTVFYTCCHQLSAPVDPMIKINKHPTNYAMKVVGICTKSQCH